MCFSGTEKRAQSQEKHIHDVPVKSKQLPHTERKAAPSFPMFCHTTCKTCILVILSVVIMSFKNKMATTLTEAILQILLNLVLWSSSSWLGGRLRPGSKAFSSYHAHTQGRVMGFPTQLASSCSFSTVLQPRELCYLPGDRVSLPPPT